MSPIMILFLQSVLIALQFINVGIATIEGVPPIISLCISAVVGGFQWFVQHIGNMVEPPDKTTTRVITETVTPATTSQPAAVVQTTTTKTESVTPKM